jgi:hypothetical protein
MVFQACDKHGHENAGHVSHDPGKPGAELRLDDGRKWQADSSTNHGIGKMRETVEDFTSESDVEALKPVLEQQFNHILKGCTMQGEAHNQLHRYLVPLKLRIEKLDNGNKAGALPELKAYLAAYRDYFGG